MAPRRGTVVAVLALLVVAAAVPSAVKDAIETGRVYVFPREFLEEMPLRFTGPGRLRFILQPVLAILSIGRERMPRCTEVSFVAM